MGDIDNGAASDVKSMAETMKAQAQEIERRRMELQPEAKRGHSGTHVGFLGGVRPGRESDPVDAPVHGRPEGVP